MRDVRRHARRAQQTTPIDGAEVMITIVALTADELDWAEQLARVLFEGRGLETAGMAWVAQVRAEVLAIACVGPDGRRLARHGGELLEVLYPFQLAQAWQVYELVQQRAEPRWEELRAEVRRSMPLSDALYLDGLRAWQSEQSSTFYGKTAITQSQHLYYLAVRQVWHELYNTETEDGAPRRRMVSKRWLQRQQNA